MMQYLTKKAEDTMEKMSVVQGSTQPKWSEDETMKALVYQGTSMMGGKRVAYENKPMPMLTHEKDVIMKVDISSISGCDLNVYSGDVPAVDKGQILGHEAVGVVHEVGSAVTKFKRGDRVVLSLNIACGDCEYCAASQFSECDRTNDSTLFGKTYGGHRGPAAIFGYSSLLGGVPGTQAEFVRVPMADVNLCHIPDGVSEEKALFASDILASGLHATTISKVNEGDIVAIWGLGPVGLAAAMWCKKKGAKRIIGIDRVRERLLLAQEKFGIETIDRAGVSDMDLVNTMMERLPLIETSGGGVDVAIEASGFRYTHSTASKVEKAMGMQTDNWDILNEMAMCTRKYGRIAILGDYVGGMNHFPIGHVMQKHLTVVSGFVPVQRYFKPVMEALADKEMDPTPMVTHHLTLKDAPLAYDKLFGCEEGFMKVLLHTSAAP